MKPLLGAFDIQEVIEKDYNELEDETFLTQQQKDNLKDSRIREKKALFLIYQALHDNGFEKIYSVNSANEA